MQALMRSTYPLVSDERLVRRFAESRRDFYRLANLSSRTHHTVANADGMRRRD
jgi:hypothetical protein